MIFAQYICNYINNAAVHVVIFGDHNKIQPIQPNDIISYVHFYSTKNIIRPNPGVAFKTDGCRPKVEKQVG